MHRNSIRHWRIFKRNREAQRDMRPCAEGGCRNLV